MKKLKVLVGAALALVLALAPVPSRAEDQNTAPSLGGLFNGVHYNLDFYGVKPCRISDSTTAVLCKAGEGFLDAVCADGGLPANYSLGLDSGVAGSRSVTNSDSLLLTPMVFALSDTAAANGQQKCWSAKDSAGGPVKFVNGLVGVQSASSHSTILYWHYSNGANP